MNHDWDGYGNEAENDFVEDDVEYYALRPNKTRIKKEIKALFDLAEELSSLTPGQLAGFELPETLHNSLLEAGSMPPKGARKRLLKYIAGQFHKMDVEPILERLARLKNQSAHGLREHHAAERWRDRLLQGDAEALTKLLGQWPSADSQKIKQLMRNAGKELEQGKPPKSARIIYRYLKDLFALENKVEASGDGVEGMD